jgi:DNA repair exonuclease SbcCD nuclease subunit
MFKFLHAADIHLDSPLKGLERYEGAPVEEIRQATRRAFENLIRLAIEEQVAFVLIAGDLYDGDWNCHNTGLYFVKQIIKLRDANIPVFVISGNHDAANKMTKSLPLPKNPDGTEVMLSHKKPQSVVLDHFGVAIHGKGFAKSVVDENVVPDYPAALLGHFNIGILHTSLDSESEDEHARYAPCRIGDLTAKGYQYWALGHIHKRDIRIGDPPIVFPGNIQGRHIREAGEKGCMLVTVDDQGRPNLEFQPLDVFRWHTCEVPADRIEHGDDLLEAFSKKLSRLVGLNNGLPMAVRVTVIGPCPAHQKLISDPVAWTNQLRATALEVASGSVWIEKVKFRTTPARELDESVLADGPIGELVEMIHDLRADDERMRRLSDELGDFWRKLPDELKRGPDALLLDDPRQLRELLDQVQPLLVGRLLSQGDVE